MVIVCATDNNFVQHCCIMLVSLLKNNNNVVIYILQEDLDEKNINIISSEVKNQNGIVHFCNIDRLVIDNLPMPKKVNLSHISRATYYRLLMPDLLPSDLEKVIYLDCDIIVNQSIYDLWNTDISNVAIAAVPQIGSGYEAERLGYPLGYGYFNAGVTIVNLKYWREHRIALKLINYLSDNCNTIIYHDQDALNAILYDQCFHLLPKWNLTSMYYSFLFKKRGDRRNGKVINDYRIEKDNAIQYLKKPIILHYTSKPKPWNDNCFHPLAELYYNYANETLFFRNIPHKNKISRSLIIIKQNVKYILSDIKQSFIKSDPSRL